MKLYSFSANGAVRLGASLRGQLIDLEAAFAARVAVKGPVPGAVSGLPNNLLSFLRLGEPAWLAAREALAFMSRRPAVPVGQQLCYAFEEVRLLAPLAAPGKILCVSEPPETPAGAPLDWGGACKLGSTLIGSGTPVQYPRGVKTVSVRPAFALILGGATDAAKSEDVFGSSPVFTLLQDAAACDEQGVPLDPLWSRNYDTFCPLGPCVTTADELGQHSETQVRLHINNTVSDQAPLDGIWRGLAAAVARLRRLMTLQPGDVIAIWTGEARCVRPGDALRLELGSVAVLENAVQASSI